MIETPSLATKPRAKLALAAGLAVALVTVALLAPLPPIWRSNWRYKALDIGHIPLFAGLTIVLDLCLRDFRKATLVATSLAGLGELAQEFVGRSGNVADFLRGVVGVLLVAVWRRASTNPTALKGRVSQLVVTAALLSWPVADATPVFADAVVGYWSFPVLCDFSTRWQTRRWTTRQCQWQRIEINNKPTGQLTFRHGPSYYCGTSFSPAVRNWSAYKSLVIDVELPGEPLDLHVVLIDERPETGYFERYNRELTLPTGASQIVIDLETARLTPGKNLDLTRIRTLQLVTKCPSQDVLLRVNRLYLQ